MISKVLSKAFAWVGLSGSLSSDPTPRYREMCRVHVVCSLPPPCVRDRHGGYGTNIAATGAELCRTTLAPRRGSGRPRHAVRGGVLNKRPKTSLQRFGRRTDPRPPWVPTSPGGSSRFGLASAL